MPETPSSTSVYTKLERIAELARKMPDAALTTLAHNIDIDWLYEAHRRTRKSGASGVDAVTAREYGHDLGRNLENLLARMKAGTYRAPPVRRVHIPKGDGGQKRPIGIPTFEDKVLQRAVAMVLEAVYEQTFLDCSYGFRPGRSAHQMLKGLRDQIMTMRGGWILEVDIEKFFDTLDHGHLRTFLRQRVHDGALLRMVGKWLKAGVLEESELKRSDTGTPQGGVISPLLANVYLHEVLDAWFESVVQPRLAGQARLFRYADDFVIVLSREDDARRVLAVLPKRFGRFGLTLHPEKTRLHWFKRPHRLNPVRPATFDLLGFTLYWAESRNRKWVVKLRTARSRLSRALRRAGQWCRKFRHSSVRWQWEMLCAKLRGHYAYFGVTGNFLALSRFRHAVRLLWRKWLLRRSRRMTSKRLDDVLEHFKLPNPTIVVSLGT